MKIRVCALTASAIFVALLGCGKPAEEHPAHPTLATDRDALQFGQEYGEGVYLGTSKQDSLLIENDGLEPLVIDRIDRAGDPEFSMEPPADTTVPALGHTFVRVFFAPKEEKTYHGSLTIVSNATNAPNKVVELSGVGVKPGTDGGK